MDERPLFPAGRDSTGLIDREIGFVTNCPRYTNANIANYVLAVPLERNWTIEICNP